MNVFCLPTSFPFASHVNWEQIYQAMQRMIRIVVDVLNGISEDGQISRILIVKSQIRKESSQHLVTPQFSGITGAPSSYKLFDLS
jgi:hypothetical protein